MATTSNTPLDKPADTSAAILPQIRNRWSPRAFADRSVSAEDLTVLFEAARWAPSAGNQQPWRFIVARREDKASFEKLLGVLNEGNQSWAKNAAVLLLAVAKTTGTDDVTPSLWAAHDVGLALGFLVLQATELGLHAHMMAGFNQDKAIAAFAIPEGFKPITAVAIGYAGHHDSLPEGLRVRELAPRTRKPLNEIVFGETWGQPT